MLKRHGIMLTKATALLLFLIVLGFSPSVLAIYIGDLTFAIDSDKPFTSKRILNNNKSAKIYRVTISGIKDPASEDPGYSLDNGEVLFSPHMLTLQEGSGDYFKFYYNGPSDGQERYYRVSFAEIPVNEYHTASSGASRVELEPVIVLDSILVVRPRKSVFTWRFDGQQGHVKNTGNTFFKLIAKPDCHSTEEQGKVWYVRPGDDVSSAILKQTGDKYIVYNAKYIKISHDCE